MSTRGIKYNFSVGEFVLCFEPDPTKARVLYDAKILDTAITRGKNATRVPAYHIHFQGWNSSWDREVGERFILKNTDENRVLMKKLADTTKRYRINTSRNRRINEILRHAFNGRPPMMDSDSDTGDESSETEDEENEGNDSENTQKNGNINGHDDRMHDLKSESTDGSEASGGSKGSKGDDKKKKVVFELEIPEILKEELEREFIAVNKEDLYVKLPVDPNIVTILEGFVKTFCVSLLCGSPEKNKFKEGNSIPFEKNIPLCKELVDGLRICFDFTLPLILLYETEKKQYHSIIKTFKYKPPPKAESTHSPPVTPTGKRKPSGRSKSNQQNKGDISPKIPKLTPAVLTKDGPEEVTPRRLTRHAALMDNAKTATSELSSNTAENEKETEKKETLTRRELRRSRTMSGGSTTAPYVKLEPIQHDITESIISRRGDPPPPLLIPSAISHKQETSTPAESLASSVDSGPISGKEFNVECLLSWQLLPEEIAQKVPPAPSLIYGAQHLLRLFVKLPEIVNSMNMNNKKVRALQSLLECFLNYLMERREELFPESAFVLYDDSI